MNARTVVRKLESAITNPRRVRNYLLGLVNWWPVRRLDHPGFANMPVYCVSLPQAVRRRRLMRRQATRAGFVNFVFLDAIDGRDNTLEGFTASGDYDPVEATRFHRNGLTVGEVATTLSHGAAYEAIVRSGHEQALILEDDALLIRRLLERVDLHALPDDWDLVFLNSFLAERPPRDQVRGRIYGTRSWYGSSAAYLLTQQAARRLAEAYRPVIHAADGLLGRNLAALPDGDDQGFRRMGAATSLVGYVLYPEPFLNGSTVKFTGTLLDT